MAFAIQGKENIVSLLKKTLSKNLQEMLSSDGILVVASPYTWRPEYTPLENWIGGFQKVDLKF